MKNKINTPLKGVNREILFLFVLIICFFSSNLHAQPSKEEWQKIRDNFYLTLLRLDTSYSVIEIQNKQISNLDEKLNIKDSVINLQKFSIKDKDAQIENLKYNVTKPDIPQLIKFTGFYAGISAQYNFSDSILTKSTFINGLNYAIETHSGFIIADKLWINGSIGIPLSKQKIYIKAFVGYKLF